MPECKTNADCKLCESGSEALAYGPGGFYYKWIGEGRNFPQDVESVIIAMPTQWSDGSVNATLCDWTVSHKNQCGAQWSLSGSQDKPTLHPSLNWVSVWHG